MLDLPFTLYSTEGCHLCELAEQLIRQLDAQILIQTVDIVDDPIWVAAYGTTIPVIRNNHSGDELNWPFDQQQLAHFLLPSLSR